METKNIGVLTLPAATLLLPLRMRSAKRVILLDVLASIVCISTILVFSYLSKPKVENAVATVPEMLTPGNTAEIAEMPVAPLGPSKVSSKVLMKGIPDTTPYLTFEPDLLQAMYEQANYLRRSDVKKICASGIQKAEMQRTIELLQGINLLDPSVMLTTFDFYQVNTDLHKDRVRMTGYYTPIVHASRVQTPEFKVPLLKNPKTDFSAPADIWAGKMAGRGLELAWLRTEKEVRNAQLQGNCLVEFTDGKRKHLGFGGSVKGRGGRYVFFTEVADQVMGCGTFPLTARYSIAVDLRYIPLGATLLAELPDLDASGRLKGYKYRILFAQDRGGAILTTKRMDLYCGIGQKGLQEARKINGHGRLWVILPKR
ncbi:MAG: MltA domain-containing protein [Phycisphaerae bacterium]|nr:MltA domain-containing protein [Saprospiraceae bacterium]